MQDLNQEWDTSLFEDTTENSAAPWDVPVEPVVKNENIRKEEAMLLTAAESSIADEESDTIMNYQMNYERLAFNDVNSLTQSIVSPYLAPEFEAVSDMSTYDPETVDTYAQLRQFEMAQPSALHRMALESIAETDDMFLQAEISRGYAAYKISEMMENTSKGEDIANFMSDFFLPVNSKDRADFMNNVIGDADASFKEFVVDFTSKSPEERAQLYPALESAALDATDGNEARAGRFLSELYGLQDDTVVLDAIGEVYPLA